MIILDYEAVNKIDDEIKHVKQLLDDAISEEEIEAYEKRLKDLEDAKKSVTIEDGEFQKEDDKTSDKANGGLKDEVRRFRQQTGLGLIPMFDHDSQYLVRSSKSYKEINSIVRKYNKENGTNHRVIDDKNKDVTIVMFQERVEESKMMEVVKESIITEEYGKLGDKNYQEIYKAIDDKIKDLMHMGDDLAKDKEDPEGKDQSDAMMDAANKIGKALEDLDNRLRVTGFFEEDK